MARTKGVTSKTAVWAIVILLIVGLAGFGATNFGGTVRNVGTVGDTPIEVRRYARELQQEISALSAQIGTNMTLAQAQQFGIDRAVLQRMVSTVALENEAADMGLSVGDEEVRKQVLQIQSFQGSNGTFDREGYRFALQNAGISEAQFEANLRAEISRTMLQGAVASGLTAPAAYTDAILNFVAERRDFDWAVLGSDDLETPIPEPTEADLRAYYDAKPDDFMLPETKAITYVWLTPDMILDTVEINEEALQKLYDDRIDEFVKPERRLVERLVFRNEADAAAAKAAIDSGEKELDDLVAERGLTLADIDLGDVAIDDLGDAGDAVFALDGPGIVGPVETELGFALIRMNGILPRQETTFEQARAELLDEFAVDSARRSIADRIDNVDDLLAGGATLEELAAETDLRLGQIDWTAASAEGIAGYPKFRGAAATAEKGDFPAVDEFEDGGIFALRVNDVTPPRPEPFEDAKDRAAEGWRAAETVKVLTERASALGEELLAGTDAVDLGLTLNTETGLSREGNVADTPQGFLDTVFGMDVGEVQIFKGPSTVYVIRLNKISPPDRDDADIAARVAAFEESAAQSIGADVLQAYSKAIEARAGISLNQSAINAVHAQFP